MHDFNQPILVIFTKQHHKSNAKLLCNGYWRPTAVVKASKGLPHESAG